MQFCAKLRGTFSYVSTLLTAVSQLIEKMKQKPGNKLMVIFFSSLRVPAGNVSLFLHGISWRRH
jgi:hypothetical protein